MGGILLLAAMFAVYIIIYWSMSIETYGNKNYGILGFKDESCGSTHHLKTFKKSYLPHQQKDHIPLKQEIRKTKNHPFLAKNTSQHHIKKTKASYLKQT